MNNNFISVCVYRSLNCTSTQFTSEVAGKLTANYQSKGRWLLNLKIVSSSRLLQFLEVKDQQKVESLYWKVFMHCAFPENISKILNLFIHFNQSKVFSVQSSISILEGALF